MPRHQCAGCTFQIIITSSSCFWSDSTRWCEHHHTSPSQVTEVESAKRIWLIHHKRSCKWKIPNQLLSTFVHVNATTIWTGYFFSPPVKNRSWCVCAKQEQPNVSMRRTIPKVDNTLHVTHLTVAYTSPNGRGECTFPGCSKTPYWFRTFKRINAVELTSQENYKGLGGLIVLPAAPQDKHLAPLKYLKCLNIICDLFKHEKNVQFVTLGETLTGFINFYGSA